MTDCLIVGFNDYDFARYVRMVAAMGPTSGAYRDLALAFVTVDGVPVRALDVLTADHHEGRPGPVHSFHNTDFLWPTITYLGTFLARHGFTFDYVNLFQQEREAFRRKLETDPPRAVAITTTLYVIPEPIVEVVEFVRRHGPGVTVVVGGPYVRNQTVGADLEAARRVYRYVGADVYVDSAEGELALTQVLAALREGRSLDGIANVAYRSDGDYVVNARAVESNPLVGHQVDYRLFGPAAVGEMVSLRTAKSCPFACAFCGFPRRAGAYTYLPVELVERELDGLRDLGGVTTLTFLDDTFNVPKPRFKEILRMMIRKRYGFRWNAFYRSDHGDREAIQLMGEAGCEGVFLGVESGSAAMLERMNKTARPDDYLRAIPLLREAGISTYASLIVGYPGETFQTVQETVDFLETARPDFYRAQLWYADPQTPVWERREELGIEGEGFTWRHHTMDAITASDLVEKLFLAVRGSLWMPQYGFEQWSTFYLQRRGMTMAQVKTFVRCFNEVIKARLLQPDRAEPEPALREALRRSAQYDRLAAGAVPPERYPAEAYAAALRFWTAWAAGLPPGGSGDLGEPGPSSGPVRPATVTGAIGRPALDALRVRFGGDAGTLVLAAAGCVLARATGREAVTVLADLEGEVPVPLCLPVPWDRGFRAVVDGLREALERARPHAPYAAAILANPVRLREAGLGAPALALSYAFRSAEGPGGARPGPPAWPGVGPGLTLAAAMGAVGVEVELKSAEGRPGAEGMTALLACLAAAAEEVVACPDRPVGRLRLGQEGPTAPAEPAGEIDERFDFEVDD